MEKCARTLFRLIDGKVDICDLEQREVLPDLTTYDTIIVGGSIHSGKIQDGIAAFCDEHLDLLAGKRIGLFINCLYTGDKAEKQLDDAFPELLSQKQSCVIILAVRWMNSSSASGSASSQSR